MLTRRDDSQEGQLVKILISAVGRRVQLMQCFRRALRSLRIEGEILGTDCYPRLAPAAHLADRCFRVPRGDHPDFIPVVLEVCRREHVDLLIPTIDPELPMYAQYRDDFAMIGTTVAVSSPEAVRIACDKVETHRWLVNNGFPTVRQASLTEAKKDHSEWSFPVIVKPRFGSASVGVRKISAAQLLNSDEDYGPDMLVQEHAAGREHTINVFIDGRGNCLCAVPHLRIEVRGGEVSKALTVKHGGMMQLAKELAERLPGARWALNVQCFLTDDGRIQVTEINCRFGGGFPLACESGADFPRWMLEELMGRALPRSFDDWEDRLTMLRYDEAVFVHGPCEESDE